MIVKKHIERIENLTTLHIDNLTIEKLGHFNLFCGKVENGYQSIVINELNFVPFGIEVFTFKDFLNDIHYSELKSDIEDIFYLIKNRQAQIFATTQRLDVIQAFAEVAQEYKDIEAYYYRLGRSAIPSDNNRSIVSMYTTDELIEAISRNREVR
jgi:hypothetical protein